MTNKKHEGAPAQGSNLSRGFTHISLCMGEHKYFSQSSDPDGGIATYPPLINQTPTYTLGLLLDCSQYQYLWLLSSSGGRWCR